jgi:phosphate acetyltransferase
MNTVLANPSLKEIAQELDGKVLFGESYLNNQAGAYSEAMQLRNYLTHLKESSLDHYAW